MPDFEVLVVDSAVDGAGDEVDVCDAMSIISSTGDKVHTPWKPRPDSMSVTT